MLQRHFGQHLRQQRSLAANGRQADHGDHQRVRIRRQFAIAGYRPTAAGQCSVRIPIDKPQSVTRHG